MKMGRKITGGKYHRFRKKRFHTKQNQERPAILGETKRKNIRISGGNTKIFLLRSNIANILKNDITQKAVIINVEQTPQNIFYARQNRLVKGAIIETSLGKAKITNRPSQEGQVNAILIENTK